MGRQHWPWFPLPVWEAGHGPNSAALHTEDTNKWKAERWSRLTWLEVRIRSSPALWEPCGVADESSAFGEETPTSGGRGEGSLTFEPMNRERIFCDDTDEDVYLRFRLDCFVKGPRRRHWGRCLICPKTEEEEEWLFFTSLWITASELCRQSTDSAPSVASSAAPLHHTAGQTAFSVCGTGGTGGSAAGSLEVPGTWFNNMFFFCSSPSSHELPPLLHIPNVSGDSLHFLFFFAFLSLFLFLLPSSDFYFVWLTICSVWLK